MWWEVLGVSYDADLRTIKKAYAKLIKEVKPDEDSEAFIRVQKAYKAAKEHHQEKPDEFVPSKTKGDKIHILEMRDIKLDVESEFERFPLEPESENNKKEENIEIPKVNLPSIAMEERASVLDRFLILYRDIEKRTHIKYWNKFFSDLNLLEEVTLGETLIFLMETHRVFSKSVWEHIYSYIKEDGQVKSDFFHKLNDFYPDFSFMIQVDGNVNQLLKYYEVRHQLYEYALGLRDSIDQESFLEVMPLSMQDRESLHLFSEYSRENKIASFFEMYEGLYSYEHYDLITSRVHLAEYYREIGNKEDSIKYYKEIDSSRFNRTSNRLGIIKCQEAYTTEEKQAYIKMNDTKHVFSSYISNTLSKKKPPKINSKANIFQISKFKNVFTIKNNVGNVFYALFFIYMIYFTYIWTGYLVKEGFNVMGLSSPSLFLDLFFRVNIIIWSIVYLKYLKKMDYGEEIIIIILAIYFLGLMILVSGIILKILMIVLGLSTLHLFWQVIIRLSIVFIATYLCVEYI